MLLVGLGYFLLVHTQGLLVTWAIAVVILDIIYTVESPMGNVDK